MNPLCILSVLFGSFHTYANDYATCSVMEVEKALG